MKIKNLKNTIIPLLIISSVFLIAPFGISSEPGTMPNGAVYSWEETRHTVKKITIWNSESIITNSTSEYDYDFNYTYTYDYYIPGTYIVETVNGHSETNSTLFQNLTFSGNQTLNANLNVYRVDVSYGNGLQLIWMAVKDGYWLMDSWITDSYIYTSQVEGRHTTRTRNRILYNSTTYVMITEYPVIIEEDWDLEEYSYCSDDNPMFNSSDIITNTKIETNFSMPLITTLQIYTAPNGEKVAWADIFYDYLIYNDTNGDGIYSAGMVGNTTNSGLLLLHDLTSEEFCGYYKPIISEVSMYQKQCNLTDPSKDIILKDSVKSVVDRTIENLSSTIEFNAPHIRTGNDLSWDITYPDYPVNGIFYNRSNGSWSSVSIAPYNASYQHSSPGNYSYRFDYEIGEDNTYLDYTIDLPKITNDTFYNAVQGMGLAMPHYTYFMSSTDVEQLTYNDLSVPADLFNFNMGTTPIAEINMINPAKMNYTLYDFPTAGVNSEFESKGATVNEAVVQASKALSISMMAMPLSHFMGMVYTLEDYIDDDPALQNYNELFCIETVNYPTWSGERLVHDPTFIAYYVSNIDSGFPFLFALLVISIILGVAISVAMPATYKIYTIQKQEKAVMKKTLAGLYSKEKISSVRKSSKGGDIVRDINSELIDSMRLLDLLKKENVYELVDKIYTSLTAEAFWKKVKELELSAEDEIQFISDMLLLPSAERQEIIHNMLQLKNLDQKKLKKKIDATKFIIGDINLPINITIEPRDLKEKDSEVIDDLQLLEILNKENALELIDDLNLTITAKDFWYKIKELELSSEDEQYLLQDMLSLAPKERQEIIDQMLKLKNSNEDVPFL